MQGHGAQGANCFTWSCLSCVRLRKPKRSLHHDRNSGDGCGPRVSLGDFSHGGDMMFELAHLNIIRTKITPQPQGSNLLETSQ